MEDIYRYGLRRISDGKVYKNSTAIYLDVEKYWTNDLSQIRLWKSRNILNNHNGYEVLRFKLSLQKY